MAGHKKSQSLVARGYFPMPDASHVRTSVPANDQNHSRCRLHSSEAPTRPLSVASAAAVQPSGIEVRINAPDFSHAKSSEDRGRSGAAARRQPSRTVIAASFTE